MCFHTGYRGRTAVFELLLIDGPLRHAIADGLGRGALDQIIQKSDFVSMADNCRRLVLEGVTSLEEARRAMSSSDL